MSERQREPTPVEGSGSGPGLWNDPAAYSSGTATVAHGPYAENLPVVGMAVEGVRRRFADRLDIDPRSQAFVNGEVAAEDRRLEAGEVLMFMRRAGEKGVRTAERLSIEGEWILAVSPEGQRSALRISSLMELAAAPRTDTGRLVLPEGCRGVVPLPRGFAVVWEGPPRVWPFRWIAADSPAPFGPETTYREVRLALPFVIVIAVFVRLRSGTIALSDSNECFFRNERLRSLDDGLCYPALLNCSRFAEPDANPLSWICTQHLDRSPLEKRERDLDALVDASLRRLVGHLFGSKWNLSSDFCEASSWFSETVRRDVDPRLRSVETWQEASRRDPCFALEVDWIPTGHTVRGVLDRIAGHQTPSPTCVRSRKDLTRIVFNHGRKGGPR